MAYAKLAVSARHLPKGTHTHQVVQSAGIHKYDACACRTQRGMPRNSTHPERRQAGMALKYLGRQSPSQLVAPQVPAPGGRWQALNVGPAAGLESAGRQANMLQWGALLVAERHWQQPLTSLTALGIHPPAIQAGWSPPGQGLPSSMQTASGNPPPTLAAGVAAPRCPLRRRCRCCLPRRQTVCAPGACACRGQAWQGG